MIQFNIILIHFLRTKKLRFWDSQFLVRVSLVSRLECKWEALRSRLPLCRLQLKRGLFWYRHYPKLHQMVKYGSSRVLVWTIRRQITLRVFFISNKWRNMTIWSNKTSKMLIFVKTNLWEATCLTPKLEKINVPI